MIVTAHDVRVAVDYGQFYLKDASAEWLSDRFGDDTFEAHLGVADGFVYVGSSTELGEIPVRVEVYDDEPGSPAPQWRHVAEVSLPTDGTIEVHHWDGDEPACAVQVPAGPIRLRVLWGGLVPPRRLMRRNAEHLTIQAWPAPPADRRVLRWWSGWQVPPEAPFSPSGRRQVEGTEAVVARLHELRRLPVAPDNTAPFPAEPQRRRLPLRRARVDRTWFHGVLGDLSDGSWWADGVVVRRMLRETTADEVRALLPITTHFPWPYYRRDAVLLEAVPYATPPVARDDHRLVEADPRWRDMLEAIGYPTVVIDI